MNVSKCFTRGLPSVAYAPILHPQLKIRRVLDSSGLLVLQGRRGIYISLASLLGCGLWGRMDKESDTISSTVRVEALFNSCSWISCASSEPGVAETQATKEHSRRLIMYSKPGCCLCDGLKEKLSTMPNVELEIRNILTKPEWENAYQYEIPVLAHIREDGAEETIPRLSPRLSAEQMQKKLQAFMG